MDDHSPTPRTAIVTGASRGLGLGIARCLAADHQVVLAARSESDLAAARDLVGDAAITVPTDITSETEVERLVAITLDRFGSVDLLVNNAAAPPVLDPLESLSIERFRRAFDVDVQGTLIASQAVAAHMRARGHGTIVNLIAARGGLMAGPAHLSVSPSQAALLALTRCLAAILQADGITVHALFPSLSPDGETGRIAAPALGVELGKDALTAGDVGDAVLELLKHSDPGSWSIEPGGTLAAVVAPGDAPRSRETSTAQPAG